MSTPQLIISLSPSGELTTELPGLNGSRRKINLKAKTTSTYGIESAIETLRDIAKIEADNTAIKDSTKAESVLNQLQNKIQAALQAANLLSNLLSEENTLSDILLNILNSQQSSKIKLGSDGNPTEQQVIHWQRHGLLCQDKDCKINKRGGLPHSHKSPWSDPSCPFCKSEGRFEPGYNREDTKALKGISQFDILRLGLISRGFTQSKNNPDIWTKRNMDPIFLLPSGQIKSNKQVIWSKEHRETLIQDGKIHAKTFGFNPPPTIHKHKGCTVKRQVETIKETHLEKLQRKIGTLNF